MKSCELLTSLSLITCSIAECYTTEELDFLANIFQTIGQNLETIVSQRALCEKFDQKK